MKRMSFLCVTVIAGCLAGCVSRNSWQFSVKALGGGFEISHHVERDTDGQPVAIMTFDDWGKKTIDAWFGWLTRPKEVKAVESPPVVIIEPEPTP